jgi:hypothetical protein
LPEPFLLQNRLPSTERYQRAATDSEHEIATRGAYGAGRQAPVSKDNERRVGGGELAELQRRAKGRRRAGGTATWYCESEQHKSPVLLAIQSLEGKMSGKRCCCEGPRSAKIRRGGRRGSEQLTVSSTVLSTSSMSANELSGQHTAPRRSRTRSWLAPSASRRSVPILSPMLMLGRGKSSVSYRYWRLRKSCNSPSELSDAQILGHPSNHLDIHVSKVAGLWRQEQFSQMCKQRRREATRALHG